MTATMISLPGEATELLEELADLRTRIARKRFADLRGRYPEIPDQDVQELDKADLVMQALKREIAHQRTVMKDINSNKE
jgi:hypothetical protein